METNSQLGELRRIRVLFVLGAIVYTIWWFPYVYSIPGAYDPLWFRCLCSLLCLFVIFGSYVSSSVSRGISWYATAVALVIVSHQFIITYKNHFHIAYAMGMFIALNGLSSSFYTLRALKVFSFLSLAIVSLVFWFAPTEFPREIFFLGFLTTLTFSYINQLGRLKIMKDLEEARQDLQEAQKIAQLGVFEFDIAKGQTRWSEETFKINERSLSEGPPTFEQYYSTVHPDDREEAKTALQKVMREGIDYSADRRIITKKGLKYIYIKNTPYKDASGKIVKVKGVSMDITRRRKAEVKLAQSFKMASLGEMAGGVAHEINSPLAAIKLMAGEQLEVLSGLNPNLDMLKKMALKIEHTSDRIAKIIEALKFFSRDSSQDPFENMAVKKIYEQTLSLCSERARALGIALDVHDLTTDVAIECRPAEISQLLLNLFNNAVEAVEKLPEKWIKLTVVEKSESVEFRVIDSGKGISEELESKIFQPFFTTKEIGAGPGLGLGISLGLAASHHGTLILDKTSPHTCFVVTLPKNQPKKEAKAA